MNKKKILKIWHTVANKQENKVNNNSMYEEHKKGQTNSQSN